MIDARLLIVLYRNYEGIRKNAALYDCYCTCVCYRIEDRIISLGSKVSKFISTLFLSLSTLSISSVAYADACLKLEPTVEANIFAGRLNEQPKPETMYLFQNRNNTYVFLGGPYNSLMRTKGCDVRSAGSTLNVTCTVRERNGLTKHVLNFNIWKDSFSFSGFYPRPTISEGKASKCSSFEFEQAKDNLS